MNPAVALSCLSLSESERSLEIPLTSKICRCRHTSVRAHTLGRLSLVVCDTIIMAFRGLFHGMLALASLILGMHLRMQMFGLSR